MESRGHLLPRLRSAVNSTGFADAGHGAEFLAESVMLEVLTFCSQAAWEFVDPASADNVSISVTT